MDWQYVDNVLEKYRQDYSKKQSDLKDELSLQFKKKIKNLYDNLSESDLEQFKRFLERNEEYAKDNDYVAYMMQKYKYRQRIKYKEMVDMVVLVLYAKFQKENYSNQYNTLAAIASNVYSSTIKQVEKMGHKPIEKIPKFDDILLLFIFAPNEKGLTYEEQNDADTIYNARQISQQITVDIMSGKEPDIESDKYQDIFDKQKRREINKKKDQKQQDKYSGYIDDESTYIINQIKYMLYKKYGFEYCVFVGVEDERQTEMCKSLNGQVFSLNELNVYSRYSALDRRDVTYHTVGMMIGENLPPITNHKHACRSWIEPWGKQE